MQYWLHIMICFVISAAASAQEYNEVSFWLEKIDPASHEFQSLNIERFMPDNYLSQFYPDMNFENKLQELPTLKPYTNTILFDKSFIRRPAERITWENKRYSYMDLGKSYPKGTKNLDIEMNYKLNSKLSLDFTGYYKKYPTISPAGLYQSEIQTNLSYYIAKNIKIKTGMQYGYNPITKRWENMYMAGIAIDF